jgi:hypothetical protein
LEDKYGSVFNKITIVQPVMRKVRVTSKLPKARPPRFGRGYGKYEG